MFYRGAIFFTFLVSVFTLFNSFLYADDFGCEALLCLSNPGGPMQYEECRPTIRRLYDLLYNRHPFPKCDMDNSDSGGSSVRVNQGYERCIPCEESYGEGYELVKMPVESEVYCACQNICRKLIRVDREYVCRGDVPGNCEWQDVPVYDEKPQQSRSKPYYVEVYLDGQRQGERLYYKKKSKKKSGPF
jgi:hypothetical protein